MIPHDTDQTVASIHRHLGAIFAQITTEILPEEEHDGMYGEPVAAVQVNGLVDIYPHQSPEGIRWALDRQVDASDPSVGIFGTEPEAFIDGLTLYEAMLEIAAILVQESVWNSFQAEAEDREEDEGDASMARRP